MANALHSPDTVTSVALRDDRLAPWFRDARLGLFVHWGLATGGNRDAALEVGAAYPYDSVADFERTVAASGWSARTWAESARRLHARYLTVATFHNHLGHLKIWQSDVPGSPHTERDYLREILDAAALEGIHVIVYITRDPARQKGGETVFLDKLAYQAHTGDPSVDLTTQDGFLAYATDVIDELIARYPEVAGFWFDGYHDDEEAQQLFAHIHEQGPHLLTLRNNFGRGTVTDEDVMSLEDFGKISSPDFDFASGTWVGAGDKEFALKAMMDWFYVDEDHPEFEIYAPALATVPSSATVIKRILSIAGSSWNAHLGFGPRLDGSFPAPLAEFIDDFERFMEWAAEAIHGTVGGGYDQGGFPPGHWNAGAYGVTTLTRDARTHYLHVLTAPSTPHLSLPDGGYDVMEAVDLGSGQVIPFTQHDGRLEVTPPSWDATDEVGATIIRLKVGATRRILPTTVARTIDAAMSQPITLPLEREFIVTGLGIRQPETGAVAPGGYAAPVSERLERFTLETSRDGVEWVEAIGDGALANQRGLQVVVFPSAPARFIRVTFLSNYASTSTCALSELSVITAS